MGKMLEVEIPGVGWLTVPADPPKLGPRKPEGCYYDPIAAEMPIWFSENFCVHIKGDYAGRPVILEEWEKELFRACFGWKRPDGTRLYRQLYLEIPRKNGKSLLATVIALYLLVVDREPGAEIYSAATDKKQARIVFDQAKSMIKRSPRLSKICKVYRDRIVIPETDSFYEVIPADAGRLDGFNAHGIIFDELHAQKDRRLYDVLQESTASRSNSLEVYITTAGADIDSICYELHEYTEKVNDGTFDDEAAHAWLGKIYAADKDDDPGSMETWAKANPNLGVTVKIDKLRDAWLKAKVSPTGMPAFLQKRLNVWANDVGSFISSEDWRRCGRRFTIDDMSGLCFMAVDLSSKLDTTAVSLCFPDARFKRFRVVTQYFCPEDTAASKQKSDRVPYLSWAEQGWITLTPGEVIDYDWVAKYISDMLDKFDVEELAFDPWKSTDLQNRFIKAGAEVVEFRQGYKSMAPACQDFEGLVASRQVQHDFNPVTRWQMGCLSIKMDEAGNIKPDKNKSRLRHSKARIDGPVSIIMATSRAIAYRDDGGSVYDDRGVIVV